MVGVAGASWTMTKIFEQIDGGLTHHLGIPMGKYVRCPCWCKDKEELFNLLPDYCVPTVIVTMNEDGPVSYSPRSTTGLGKCRIIYCLL